jgi:hypothetical protein
MSDNRRECADEILTLCQRRWARREAEPVLIEDVLPILAKHFPPAVTVEKLKDAYQQIKKYADDSYCKSCDVSRTTPCLGWEAKVKDGSFGEAEYNAHREAENLDGKHRGTWFALEILQALITEQEQT